MVFPFFHIAEWVVRWIVIAAVIGFPFALFSWFYEWTPQGLQREMKSRRMNPSPGHRQRSLIAGLAAALGLAVVFLLVDKLCCTRMPMT